MPDKHIQERGWDEVVMFDEALTEKLFDIVCNIVVWKSQSSTVTCQQIFSTSPKHHHEPARTFPSRIIIKP